MAVKHKKVSTIADDPQAAADGEVLPSEWNDEHEHDAEGANKVLAGPASGGAAKPTFRALIEADVPDGADATAIHKWEGYISFGSDSPISGQTYAP